MKRHFTPEELHDIQLQLEADMHGNGIDRFNANNDRAIKEGSASSTAWNRRLIKSFVEPFAEAIEAYLEYYNGRRGKPSRSLVYLRMLPTQVSAYVAIKVIFDSLPQAGLSVQSIGERIGRRIEDQVRFTKLEDTAPKYVDAIKRGLKQAKSQKYDHGQTVMVHGEKMIVEGQQARAAYLRGASFEVLQEAYGFDTDQLKRILGFKGDDKPLERWAEWDKQEVIHLGIRLIDIFAANVLYEGQPIIDKEVRDLSRGGHKSVAYLKPTPVIVDWIEQFRDVVSQLSPCYAPCVVLPRPWTGPNQGGFHTVEVASRLPMVKADNYNVLKRLTVKQMPVVYRAINALQAVRWTINEQVLDAALEVLERDLNLGIPQRQPYETRLSPVPEEMRDLKRSELKGVMSKEQWDAFEAWRREAAACYDEERERRSKYVEATRTIKQAEMYREYPELHFVYTADFRGRVYAQSSLVGPQGSDLQKALIQFSDGMELGEQGRYWLAVHGSSVYGNDKVSLDEMAAFIEEIEEDILDYASDPCSFKGWGGVDKPYQFLAFCFEWAALKAHEDAGNPASSFVSYISCAQDGSCSGIQHYSAMLRDPVGGEAVNLRGGKDRQDIYGKVAEVTTEKLKRVASGKLVLDLKPKKPKGYEGTAAEWLAEAEALQLSYKSSQVALALEWLRVGVTRGGVKKPVMTLPYGSSQLTCRESIGEYLNELQAKERKQAKANGRPERKMHNFSDDKAQGLDRFEAEKFLSRIVWESIGEVVVAARSCMKFLKAVCGQVSKHNKPLEWATPTGFIVHQAIFEVEEKRIVTQLMGRTDLTLHVDKEDIDVYGMKGACSPNFVHSMDASHLILAVDGFKQAGIDSICVIHDSFGTHAGNTHVLRKVLVDTFVDMYEQNDVLANFSDYQEEQLCEELVVERPESLGLDLNEVRESRYAFA